MPQTTSDWHSFGYLFFWYLLRYTMFVPSVRLLSYCVKNGVFSYPAKPDAILKTSVFGKPLSSPVGVADLLSEQAELTDGLIRLGFSFGEMGPFTKRAEKGGKAASYLIGQRAIARQNDGLANIGLEKMRAAFIARRYLPHVVGINITITNASLDEEKAAFSYRDEFAEMIPMAAPYCDYVALNFGIPKTGLAAQVITDEALLLNILKDARHIIQKSAPYRTPALVVKLPLDLSVTEARWVCSILLRADVDGIIVAGPQLLSAAWMDKYSLPQNVFRFGLLSGMPVKHRVLELVSIVYQNTKGKIPIIGCGG
ncbi:MAG: hypothetical protein PHX68_03230, partial [Alphaproteobacteria bacterium]|nr:hypothetical protein [Alphaproteobacteria bacterium]